MSAEFRLMMSHEQSSELEDATLVEQAIEGDEGSFEILVRRKTSKVYGHCYRLIGNAEDARDISQLVFIKLWENLEKYDSSFAFDTWLYRIVTNVAIDFVRSRQSRETAVKASLRLVSDSSEAEQPLSLQRQEIEQIFHEIAEALSPRQREIFVMKEMEDISSAEISRILGCRESTVRNHLFNARQTLKEELYRRYPEYAQLWEGRP